MLGRDTLDRVSYFPAWLLVSSVGLKPNELLGCLCRQWKVTGG